MPTVEQIVRAAIYKEMKNLTYRELEYERHDSRMCATFSQGVLERDRLQHSCDDGGAPCKDENADAMKSGKLPV